MIRCITLHLLGFTLDSPAYPHSALHCTALRSFAYDYIFLYFLAFHWILLHLDSNILHYIPFFCIALHCINAFQIPFRLHMQFLAVRSSPVQLSSLLGESNPSSGPCHSILPTYICPGTNILRYIHDPYIPLTYPRINYQQTLVTVAYLHYSLLGSCTLQKRLHNAS